MAGKTTPAFHRPAPSATTASFQSPSIDHLLHLGPSGVVFKSHESLEMGMELAVGLHIQQHIEDEAGDSKVKNRFIILEGVVVDNRRVDTMVDEPYFQISLLFDGLDEEAEEMIQLLCDQQAASDQKHPGDRTPVNSMPTVALN